MQQANYLHVHVYEGLLIYFVNTCTILTLKRNFLSFFFNKKLKITNKEHFCAGQ